MFGVLTKRRKARLLRNIGMAFRAGRVYELRALADELGGAELEAFDRDGLATTLRLLADGLEVEGKALR